MGCRIWESKVEDSLFRGVFFSKFSINYKFIKILRILYPLFIVGDPSNMFIIV